MPFSGVGRLHRHYAADQCAGEMGAGQCDHQVRLFFLQIVGKSENVFVFAFFFVFVDVFFLVDSLALVGLVTSLWDHSS